MTLILGAGLGGLACSYHLGHEKCLLLERKSHAYGHVHTEFREGFTWDEGPHVSFTKSEYVRDLLAASVDGDFDEYEVSTSNYFRGHWIDHPAQSSLHQIPEPLRSQCLDSFLRSREQKNLAPPAHYGEWLERAFGPVFARHFPAAYTLKYWTVGPEKLTIDWLGPRIFYPEVEDVVAGSKAPLNRNTHYITNVRYPRRGGYQAFAEGLRAGARIRCDTGVEEIDLAGGTVRANGGEEYKWRRLVNTLPLPDFVALCKQVPTEVDDAARVLACSSLLLVNVTAKAPTARRENWMYVYDEDKLSTRINCTERLTLGNAPGEHTGIQVEVYFSRFRPMTSSAEEIGQRVVLELREMGLLPEGVRADFHTRQVPWANVIFTPETTGALDVIWRWLETYGLRREEGDCHPLTDWSKPAVAGSGAGRIAMAGRYAQWKYFWTDDCVLRGKALRGS